MPIETALLADGLSWPESPRWRDGEVFISDVHNFRIAKLAADGSVTTLCKVEGRPAGMDFGPDGQLTLATGIGRQLLRIDPKTGQTEVVASLPPSERSYLNDLVADVTGRVWFGETGFRFGVDEPEETGRLWTYHPDTGLEQVATEVFFPNGVVINADGTTLYVAETFGKRVSAFDIGDNGALSNRRVHATLRGEPDGLSLDAEGFLWVPLLFIGEFVRISPDGREVEKISFPGMNAIACISSGTDRKELLLCVCRAERSNPQKPILEGALYRARVATAGAGRP